MSQNRHENAASSWAETVQANAARAHSIENYRAHATILRALAVDTPDPEIKTRLLVTAAQFDRLADYAAASGRADHAA